jgi:hypothetical protein
MERVSDERISYVLDSLENRWVFVGPDEMESLLRELQSRRAAEREQAAPKAEPKLPKWERRIKEAQIILWPPRVTGQNQTDKWIAHIWAMGEWSADTPKAAVKAAWRAWKEARRDA